MLKHLTSLILDGTNLNDTTLAFVFDLPALETLDLESTQITDESLARLAKQSSLKALSLWKSPRITPAGMARFRKLRPDVDF